MTPLLLSDPELLEQGHGTDGSLISREGEPSNLKPKGRARAHKHVQFQRSCLANLGWIEYRRHPILLRVRVHCGPCGCGRGRPGELIVGGLKCIVSRIYNLYCQIHCGKWEGTNGFLGLSLKGRTVLFLAILLDNTVSVG